MTGKRLIASILAVLLGAAGLFAQYREPIAELEDSETASSLRGHVSMLAGAQMEGRAAGSEGERMAGAYLEEQLRAAGVEVLPREEFGVMLGDTLRSFNVVGFLQGWDPDLSKRYIVIGARMDGLGSDTFTRDGETLSRTYYGANANASGMAMMLELSKKLSRLRNLTRRSILFVGFGAGVTGAWYFLNRAFSDAGSIDAMINLDILGMPAKGFEAYTASNEDLSSIVKSLQGELLPMKATLSAQEPYPGCHSAFYDREIPSVLFTSGRYLEHDSPRDTPDILDYEGMERELEYIYSYSIHLCNGAAPLFRNSDARQEVPSGTWSFSDVDIKPRFMNSQDPQAFLREWVYKYLKYPSYALENGIQGRVLVDFIVNEKGDVVDVKVSRSIHESLDAEALRVIKASPRWRPGRKGGKTVRTAMTVAVDFRLEKNKGRFGINGKAIK